MNILTAADGGRILLQNEACLVINKLPGESSETDESPGSGGEGEKFPVPVHRLDVPVSGCLLLAKTPGAAAFLGDVLARREGRGRAEKRYWAIIEKPSGGLYFPAEAELVHWIREDRKRNKSYALPLTENPPAPEKRRGKIKPKKAALRYRIAGEGENYIFLEIDLLTGRHHQIRAQLAAQGLHIKGDLKYGAKRSERGGGIRLHAYSLAFPDPLKPGGTIRVSALPPVMDSLWTAFAQTITNVPPGGQICL